MLISMTQNKLKKKILFFFIFFFNFYNVSFAQMIILSDCKSFKDDFIKNEYILDLEKSLMTRNYIYDNKTYKKHRITDLSIKKKNTIERFIYEDKNLIFTDQVGYPLFYTQLIFEKKNPTIYIKTVINGEEAVSKISTCNKIEIFEKKS